MFKKLLNSIAYITLVSLILNIGAFAMEEQSDAENNTKLNNACFRLLSLDAVDGAMLNNGEVEVTRGEFAHLVLKLLSYDSSFISDDKESKFIDVSNDHGYKKDIILASELNLINGYPDNTFKPNEFIMYEDIATILVKALGYVEMAQSNGGYPSGYLAVAAQINLLTGTVVKYGEPITYNDIFLIFDNALEAEIITRTIGSETYLVKDGQTLYDVKMDMLNLTYGKGRLNGNNITSIYGSVSNIADGQVLIGDQRFYTGSTDASDMLGYDVEYYAEQSSDGDIETLKNIRISRQSSSITIKADQILSVTSNKIEYDDKQNISLANNLNVIYNMKFEDNFAIEDLLIENGSLEAIDADNDGEYETIFVREYQLLTVESVNVDRQRIYFKDQGLNNSKYLEFTTAKDYDIEIYDDSNNEFLFEDIKADDVIEVYSSLDNKIVRIYVIKNTVTGKINSMRTEGNKTYVVINDIEYAVNPEDVDLDADITLGAAGVFYVNPDNIIVKYTENAEETNLMEKIALIQQIDIADGLGSEVSLRLVNAGTYKTTEEDTNEDGILDTRYLEINNSSVETYKCADEIILNNNKINSSELRTYLNFGSYPKNDPVIRYRLNSNNQISKIDIAQPYGNEPANKTLNIRARLFGGSTNSFIMDDDTKIISVPPELKDGYEEGLFLTASKLEDQETFEVLALDVDIDTKIAKAVVIVTPESLGTSTINSRTKVSIISDISRSLNEDQIVYKISGYTGAESYSEFATDSITSEFDDLQAGDLILYSQDYKGRINNIEIVKKFDDLKEYYNLNSDTRVEVYGKVVSVRTNYVPDAATDLQNLVTVDVSNTDTPYETRVLFSAISLPPIYVYDSQKDKIYAGDITDIQPSNYVGDENASEIFAYSTGGTVKVIFVIDK